MRVVIGEKELGPEFANQLKLAVDNRVDVLKKVRRKVEAEGLFRAVQEIDDQLHVLRGGDGEAGLTHFLDDQMDAFEDNGQYTMEDEAQTAATQSIDEALDDPAFEKQDAPEGSDFSTEDEEAPTAEDPKEPPKTPFDDDDTDLPWESDDEEGMEAQGKAFDDGEPVDPDTLLTDTELRTSPTTLAILKKEGIETLAQLAARRWSQDQYKADFEGVKGIGPATLGKFDEVLAEVSEHGWGSAGDSTEDEQPESDGGAGHVEETAAASEEEDEPTTNRDGYPSIGDTVVPEKNPSFTMEVVDVDDDAVILQGTGVAAGESSNRYALLEDLTWDSEHGRWTTSKLHMMEEAGEAMPV